ncbi:MAG: LptA/OstA family protein [Steroidobacteraceae bacterium]
MATSRLDALLIALLCGAAMHAAAAQERNQLPIDIKADSSDFDYQNGVLVFEAITITQGQIRITADRAVASGLEFEDSRWEFSGTVRITMPEAALASDTARVRFSGGQIASATVTGAPATFDQQRKDEHAQGRANRIDYDLGLGAVELAGDAWLFDGRTEITGATLVYSTANQRVISQEPVVITIQPEETPPETPKPPP